MSKIPQSRVRLGESPSTWHVPIQIPDRRSARLRFSTMHPPDTAPRPSVGVRPLWGLSARVPVHLNTSRTSAGPAPRPPVAQAGGRFGPLGTEKPPPDLRLDRCHTCRNGLG